MVLRFMDGPYLIRARDVGTDSILLDCIESRKVEHVVFSSLVELVDLQSEISRVARAVLAECRKRNWSSAEIERLNHLP